MEDRWTDIVRPYSLEDVKRIRGSIRIDQTWAKLASEKLWRLMNQNAPVRALGAMTGNQAIQQVRAGLKAIYVSGWQTAADANSGRQMYPDQSLYPVNAVPLLIERINNALQRSDEIDVAEEKSDIDWLVPLVADAEAGFGGVLNAYELMKSMIKAGAAGVHFEDQLSSEKKCGHLNSKTLVPTSSFIRTLTAARLAADVLEVPTVLIARTDAESAGFITSDVDPRDHDFIDKSERTPEGFFKLCGDPMERCIRRGLAYAPYSDLIWMETSTPNLGQAKKFADAIHEKYPNKKLAYNCSPSFHWKKFLSSNEMKDFQTELGKLNYTFQFITLAGFHALNFSMFELSQNYKNSEMLGYSSLQEKEFEAYSQGYTAIRHQHEVGVSYFDEVRKVINGGDDSMSALTGSTEDDQF
jgi:isocitrate lyase